MYKGKLVLAQLTEHLPKDVFAAGVALVTLANTRRLPSRIGISSFA
jgi:hypothetical protein